MCGTVLGVAVSAVAGGQGIAKHQQLAAASSLLCLLELSPGGVLCLVSAPAKLWAEPAWVSLGLPLCACSWGCITGTKAGHRAPAVMLVGSSTNS